MKTRATFANACRFALLFAAIVVLPVDAMPKYFQKTVVILVDVSKSIPTDDRKRTYRESFANAFASLKPGDRLILGPVGAKDRSTWLNDFDARYPLGEGFRIADERAASDFSKRAARAFDVVMERGEKNPENATRIVDAIEAASEAFGSDPRNAKVLVILSDMAESGGKSVKSRKAPAVLEGAKVYVAGAGGGARYSEYESTWRTYFGGARITELTYGRFPARIEK